MAASQASAASIRDLAPGYTRVPQPTLQPPDETLRASPATAAAGAGAGEALLPTGHSCRHVQVDAGARHRQRMVWAAAACVAASALVAVALLFGGSRGLGAGTPSPGATQLFRSAAAHEKGARKEAECAKVGTQCAGDSFGPTCCEAGAVCVAKPLPRMASFMECQAVPEKKKDTEEKHPGAGGKGTEAEGEQVQWHQGALRKPSKEGRSGKHKATPETSTEPEPEPPTTTVPACGELWGQCGGSDFLGEPGCCVEPNLCVAEPLPHLPDYMQCRPPTTTMTTTLEAPCRDMSQEYDSQCYSKVNFDMTQGIIARPDLYPVLNPGSPFQDFQEWNSMLIQDQSHCPPTCAPGNCFFQYRYDGCDKHNLWACDGPDDGSLAFQCCCRQFDGGLTVNFTKAVKASRKEREERKKRKKHHDPTFFCVALMMPGTYEEELLQAQLKKGLGMFGCDEWAVYSNVSVQLGPGQRTDVMKGSLETLRGGAWNTAMNTGTFVKFWDKVLSDPRTFKHEWIVKLDPDCVFLPERFRQMITADAGPLAGELPQDGVYLNNCVLGMHGPIEVLSRTALQQYKANKQSCLTGDPAQHGQEDFWLRACMEALNVTRVDAFNLLLESDWACQERPSSWHPYQPPCFAPQVAFHPFKSIESYMHCWAEAVNAQLPGWIIASGDVPSPANEHHT